MNEVRMYGKSVEDVDDFTVKVNYVDRNFQPKVGVFSRSANRRIPKTGDTHMKCANGTLDLNVRPTNVNFSYITKDNIHITDEMNLPHEVNPHRSRIVFTKSNVILYLNKVTAGPWGDLSRMDA